MRLENDLGNDNIRQIVWRIALPSMLAQFVSVLYSIVDRMYIGHIPEVGDMALAGVGVCGPIVTMVSSFAFLVGVGGSPLMSMRMGEGNPEAARKIVANCFMMLCVISVVVTAVLIPLRKPMLLAFGASQTIYPFAEAYFTIYICGTLFSLLSSGMNQFIISQGFARVGMASVVIGAAANIALDPLLIFVCHMGVRGAAMATVISQIASCVFVLCFLFSRSVPVRITFSGYNWKIIGRVLALGFTPFVIIAVDNLMMIALNTVLQKYGGAESGDMLITCGTIAQSFMLMVTMPLGGITGGTQTILSFNYGAGKPERVLQAQRSIFKLCIGFTAIMFLLARLCGPLFVRLFTSDSVLAQKAVWAIRVFTLAVVPLAVQYEVVDGFTALGHVELALPLSFFRKLLYFTVLFCIPHFFAAENVFYAEAVSDIIPPVVSLTVYFLMIHKVLKKPCPGAELQKS